MEKESKISLCVALAFGVLVAVGATFEVTHRPRVTPQLASWYRSDQKAPEDFTPIIGFWADKSEGGDIEVDAVIKWYDGYYQYAPLLKPPLGGLLREYPPTWWTEMPGVAK